MRRRLRSACFSAAASAHCSSSFARLTAWAARLAALRSARVLMFSRPFCCDWSATCCGGSLCGYILPPLAMARQQLFGKTFQNQTKQQVNTHKKLLSHAARRWTVSVSAWIPGRNASAYTIAPNPTTKRAYPHAQTRTPAHASARPRAQGRGGRVKSPHYRPLPSVGLLIFLRARNWSLLRNCYGTGERRNTLHRDSGGSAF